MITNTLLSLLDLLLFFAVESESGTEAEIDVPHNEVHTSTGDEFIGSEKSKDTKVAGIKLFHDSSALM